VDVDYERAFADTIAAATNAVPSVTLIRTGVPVAKARNGDQVRAFWCDDEECDCRVRQIESEVAFCAVPNWTDIVTEAAKRSFRELGKEQLLIPSPSRICVLGVDVPVYPCRLVPATNAEITAIENLDDRAVALLANDVWAQCPETRNMILSVAEAGVIGWTLQTRLFARVPYRKHWPWWYRRPRRWPRDTRPGLFEALGIDVNAPAVAGK
jgi:hypothetical protein